MKFHYYPETDSLYIDFGLRPSADSSEVAPGVVVDYDAAGKITGIDIDHASSLTNLSQFLVSGFIPQLQSETRPS